jgi:hypothetical protein
MISKHLGPRGRLAALCLAAVLAPHAASAHSLRYAVNTVNWSFGGAAQMVVPGMTTTLMFKPVNQRLIITYPAECAVNAPAGNNSAWMDVDIVLLNAAGAVVYTAPPTAGSFDAFCSANGTAGFDGWESNAVTAVVPPTFAAGFYRAQVRARLNAGATGGWFGERQLTVSL